MKKKKAHKSTYPILLSYITVFLILSVLCVSFLYRCYYRISWENTVLTETSDTLSNPYRGWYHIYGYSLTDKVTYTADSILENIKTDTDTRLALVQINLKDYRTAPISSHALAQLETILSAWEQTDKTLILRFLYDWDGLAAKTEPDDIAVILNHMSQISTILNHHTALIYTLQGIFAGNYGEMNNSRFMTEESVLLLTRQLADVIDPSIYLSVRTPALWRQVTSSATPLTGENAFAETFKSRIGLYNDGIMGSENDCGTYGDSFSNPSGNTGKRSRSDELAFQKQLCLYVPNGGEAILDNPYNDLNTAILDLKSMHVSYLNNMYDPAVLNKWKSSIYTGADIFNGCSGYDYIGNHLGYRYVLRSSFVEFHTFRDKTALLAISLENTGFANCYKKFDVTLLLKNTDTNETLELPINTDTRTWLPGQIVKLQIPLAIRSYETGTYELYLSVNDKASGSEILFANTADYSPDGYFLGNLSITKFRPSE